MSRLRTDKNVNRVLAIAVDHEREVDESDEDDVELCEPREDALCPFPNTAVYKGSGSTDDASSFVCTGSLESKYTICNDVRTKYKEETGANLDYAGIGLDPAFCQ
jgi:hypothetical protein